MDVFGQQKTASWRFLFVIISVVVAWAKTQTKRGASNAIAERHVSVGGLSLRISTDGVAGETLVQWANELDERGATAGEASMREAIVLNAVSSGEWPASAWEEYQRLAAGTGNVDSALLLFEYGIARTVFDHVQEGVDDLVSAAARGEVNVEHYTRSKASTPDGTTALHAAALVGCTACAEALIQADPELLEAQGEHGMRPLHVAASAGHAEVVRVLLTAGAEPNARHAFGQSTALHMAAELGRVEAIDALCSDTNVDLDATGLLGGTAVHSAAQRDRADAIAALGRCGASMEVLVNGDTTPLYIAAQEGYVDSIRALVAAGANVEATMNVIASNTTGRSVAVSAAGLEMDPQTFLPNLEPGNGARPLHAAAENGHSTAVAALLEAGADPDAGYAMAGVAPLHLAAQYNRPDVTRVLIHGGASIDARSRNADGATALYYAAGAGYESVVSVLLQAGPDVNAGRRVTGATPLTYASAANRSNIVDALLKAGANLSMPARDGTLPLHAAVAAGHLGIVKRLVSAGADIEARGPDMQTPLLVALSSNQPVIAMYLLKEGRADPTPQVASSKATALHLAAARAYAPVIALLLKNGNKELLETRCTGELNEATPLYLALDPDTAALLLDAGADPNAAMANGDTALLSAISHNKLQLVRTLLSDETEPPGRSADPDLGAPPHNRPSSLHQSPLLLAVVNGLAPIVQALLDHGANCAILVQTKQRARPDNLLDISREKRDYDTLQVLSNHVEDCDVRLDE